MLEEPFNLDLYMT